MAGAGVHVAPSRAHVALEELAAAAAHVAPREGRGDVGACVVVAVVDLLCARRVALIAPPAVTPGHLPDKEGLPKEEGGRYLPD